MRVRILNCLIIDSLLYYTMVRHTNDKIRSFTNKTHYSEAYLLCIVLCVRNMCCLYYVYTSHSDTYTLFKCCKTSESAQVFYCVNKTVLSQ